MLKWYGLEISADISFILRKENEIPYKGNYCKTFYSINIKSRLKNMSLLNDTIYKENKYFYFKT